MADVRGARPRRIVVVALARVVALAASCGDDGGGSAPSTTKKPKQNDEPRGLSIVAPTNGGTVDCPVLIRVRAPGYWLLPRPAGGDDRAAPGDAVPSQAVAYIDRQPPAPGTPAGEGDGIVPLRRAAARLKTLPPGPHTVVVALASESKVLLDPAVTATTTFTVGACPEKSPG